MDPRHTQEPDAVSREVKARTSGLYVRDVGDGAGPAVLLLHAFPLNSRMWEPQLSAFGGRARLLAPDLPGFGLTPVPAEAPTLDDYADRVAEVVDLLDVDEMVVVGLSMGGYVAFRLVERLGDRITGLLLAGTRAGADTEEQRTRRHELAAEVEAIGIDAAVDELLPKLVGTTTQRLHPAKMEEVRRIARENTPAGLAGALRAMASRSDSTSILPSITCPVVCLVGSEDGITPPEVVQQMAERMQRARVIVIPEAGHLTNVERPELFDEALATLVR